VPETYCGVLPAEDNQPHRLLVKQMLVTKCDDQKANELAVKTLKHHQYEKSRTIKSDGTVIKYLENSNIEIYYPNGTIYKKINEIVVESGDHDHLDVEHQQQAASKEKSKGVGGGKGATKREQKIEEMVAQPEIKIKSKWLVVTPAGNEYLINKANTTGGEKKYELIKYYRNVQASDPHTGESMTTREDNVRLVYRPDGSSVVEYPDGTRITIFYIANEEQQNKDDEASSINKYVKVECPGFATTIFNCKTTECTLAFGNGNLASCDPKLMAYNVTANTNDVLDIDRDGIITLIPRPTRSEPSKNRFLFYQNSEVIFDHVDEEGHIFN
jgi:hypothetical protein